MVWKEALSQARKKSYINWFDDILSIESSVKEKKELIN